MFFSPVLPLIFSPSSFHRDHHRACLLSYPRAKEHRREIMSARLLGVLLRLIRARLRVIVTIARTRIQDVHGLVSECRGLLSLGVLADENAIEVDSIIQVLFFSRNTIRIASQRNPPGGEVYDEKC